jgi:hypothetical protein
MKKIRCGYYWAIAGTTLLLLAFLAGPAGADGAFTTTVDENGNGYTDFTNSSLPYTMAPDPGPGGLNPVLTYTLPFSVVAGDVIITEPIAWQPGEWPGYPTLSDVVRFNAPNYLVFYSDAPPFDSLADTISPPGTYYPNNVSILEIGPSDDYNWGVWTPNLGDPGDPGFAMTYTLYSDVPLPPSALLLGSGLLGLLGFGWRRRQG